MISAAPSSVAIVGGGASGVLLAAHLVRKEKPVRISLIDGGTDPVLGVAYSTSCSGHLLNVRASDMSALEGEPDHFVQWLARGGSGLGRTDFVPRTIYGRYLVDLLDDAIARGEGRIARIGGEVVSIRDQHDGLAVGLASGASLQVGAAVLATGHRPPSGTNGAWRGNPWTDAALDGLAPDAAVLTIGTSLTMIDILISLLERGHTGAIVALSPRGLLPHRHTDTPIPSPKLDTAPFFTGSLSARTKRFRTMTRGGTFWPGLMQLLRPHNDALWQGLGVEEQQRFLRHLRPYWDIHRHRVAPQIGRVVERTIESGRLEIIAGRARATHIAPDHVEIAITRRGSRTQEHRRFDRVIDCRGPQNGVEPGLPLHAQMVEDGLMRPDEFGIALDVTPDDALVGRDGTPSTRLSALGPPTRGRHSESIAIPDVRLQAARLAARLAG